MDEECQNQVLSCEGHSLRRITSVVGCAYTTVHYELKDVLAREEENRKYSKKQLKINSADCKLFI